MNDSQGEAVVEGVGRGEWGRASGECFPGEALARTEGEVDPHCRDQVFFLFGAHVNIKLIVGAELSGIKPQNFAACIA